MLNVLDNLSGVSCAILWSLRVSLHLRCVGPTNRARPVGPQPFVNTLPMELVAAGQNSQQLAGLKITHAHHTQCLLGLMVVWIKPIGRKLFNVSFS